MSYAQGCALVPSFPFSSRAGVVRSAAGGVHIRVRWRGGVLQGLVEPLSAVLSVVLLGPFLTQTVLDSSLLFVAGVMVSVSLQELVPQALAESKPHACAGIIVGVALVKAGLVALGE